MFKYLNGQDERALLSAIIGVLTALTRYLDRVSVNPLLTQPTQTDAIGFAYEPVEDVGYEEEDE